QAGKDSGPQDEICLAWTARTRHGGTRRDRPARSRGSEGPLPGAENHAAAAVSLLASGLLSFGNGGHEPRVREAAAGAHPGSRRDARLPPTSRAGSREENGGNPGRPRSPAARAAPLRAGNAGECVPRDGARTDSARGKPGEMSTGPP